MAKKIVRIEEKSECCDFSLKPLGSLIALPLLLLAPPFFGLRGLFHARGKFLQHGG
jgi:hypothetical protein